MPTNAWKVLQIAIDQWFAHKSARLGAALAYYSVFSMGPLLLIVISIAGLFLGADAVRGSLTSQFRSMLGDTGSKAVEAMLQGASSPEGGHLTAVTGIVLLFVAALGVVNQLKDAMNTIWNVEQPKDVNVRWYVRTYLVSFAGIMSLGFLLAVSLVISTGLAALSTWAGSSSTVIGEVLSFVASLAVLTTLFAMLYRWFPDTEIAWRDVLPGAFFAALAFNLGKSAIGWYIGTQGLESTYGAAASIVILLIWVYYSAQIVLFGAELTHAYATEIGSCQRMDVNAQLPHKARTLGNE
ncbi:MAG: YihY/virulence factor BrkB family protein [Hyphomicrobiaceae bacterium]